MEEEETLPSRPQKMKSREKEQGNIERCYLIIERRKTTYTELENRIGSR